MSSGSRLGWPDPWNKQAEMGSLAERATQVGTVSNTAMLQAPRIFRCKTMWTSPLLRYFQSRVWSSFVPSSNQCSWQDSLLSYHGKIKTGSTQGYGDSKDGISTAVLATSLIGWSNKKSPCQSTNLLSGLTALVFSAAQKTRVKGSRPLLQIISPLFLTSPPQHNGGMLTLYRIRPTKHQGEWQLKHC